MPSVFSLYIDDSGTRHPDRKVPATGDVDWFALGGVLVRDEDIGAIKTAHGDFYSRWPQIAGVALHSHEIRNRKDKFSFLEADRVLGSRFLQDLTDVLTSVPVVGHACVIHRAGYMSRYAGLYGERRWLLCKTAFAVVVERAAKFARRRDAKLRVKVERSGKAEDTHIEEYYDALRSNGMPFDSERSGRYKPLLASELHETLYELDFKRKTSPLAQIADLYLYPVCRAAYLDDRAFNTLREKQRLIDCVLSADEREELGIKYSCFDSPKSAVSTT